MTEDLFAVLGMPRRPWLEPEDVKETFHRLSRTEHPDQQGAGEGDFARLNQAQATLGDPKLRLRHLSELEFPGIKTSGPSTVPAGLADWFIAVHGVLRDTDGLLAKKAGASSALAKALLARDEHAARETIEDHLAKSAALHTTAAEELRAFDVLWSTTRPRDAEATLQTFHQRFAYLSRLTEQLRERLVQLSL